MSRISHRIVLFFLFLLLLILATPSRARDFDFGSEFMASYFRGQYGLNQVGQNAFESSSGSDTSLSDESVNTTLGGEFGFLLSLGRIGLRLGGEYLTLNKIENLSGTSSSGAKRFDLNSHLNVLSPVVHLEFYLKMKSRSRLLVSTGAGYAYATLRNEYSMTADGQANFGVSSYNEVATANALFFHFALAYEALFTDNATFFVDVGYRMLPLNEFSHSNDVATIQGAFSKGASLLNDDGSKRQLNVSGWNAGLGFRFYFDPR